MNKSFKGIWIPSDILDLLQTKDLSLTEAFLYGAILGLESDDGCYASNDYFSELINVHPNHISKMVTKLKKKNLVEQLSFNGKKRFLKTIEPDKVIAENSGSGDSEKDQSKRQRLGRVSAEVKADSALALRQGKRQRLVPLHRINKYITKRIGNDDDLDGETKKTAITKKTEDKKIAENTARDLTNKFLLCLPIKYQKPNIKNNSINHFSMLRDRDKISFQEIEKTINWYAKNLEDQYTPKTYDAKTFRKKYHRILNAVKRTQNQSPETQEIEITSEAEKIVEQLQTKIWPKDTSEKLAPYVQLSLNNYKKFYAKITKLSEQEPDENLNRSDRIKSRNSKSIINHLIESLSSPTHFISSWFDNIWERTHNWEQWSGNLKPLMFTIGSNEFEKHISNLFVSFGRSASEATRFLSEIQE